MQAKGFCRVFCRIAIIFLLANIVFSERLPKKRVKPDLRDIHSAGLRKLRKLGHPLVAKQAEAPPTAESPMPDGDADVIIDHDYYNDSSCDFDTQTFSIQSPDSLFQLDAKEKVIFYVRGRYTQGLMMRVSVLHEGKPYHDETYVPQANCRDLVQKRFHFLNKAAKPPNYDGYDVDAAVPSHLKKLTVFVSVGTENHSSNEHCYDLICAKYELHFDFLPKPRNIFVLSNKPRPIDKGQSANLTCLTLDGNPLAENFGFRMRDLETGEIIGQVDTTTLELELATAAAYTCLVLSRAFGKETIVESFLDYMVFNIRPRVDDGSRSVPDGGSRSGPDDGGRSVPDDGGRSVTDIKDPRGKTKHKFLKDDDDQMDKETPKKLASTSTASKVEFVFGLLVSTFVVILLESHFF